MKNLKKLINHGIIPTRIYKKYMKKVNKALKRSVRARELELEIKHVSPRTKIILKKELHSLKKNIKKSEPSVKKQINIANKLVDYYLIKNDRLKEISSEIKQVSNKYFIM